MRVVITGVPGAGKTTIAESVKKKVRGVHVVNVGDMIFEIAKKKLKLKDRDQMREKISIKQQQKYQEEVCKKISKMRASHLIIDTHTSVRTPEGYFPGMGEKSAELIKPDVIVCLDYEPDEIIKRRKNDPSRHRDEENEEDIEKDQKSIIEFAYEAAAHVEAAVQVIDLRYSEKKELEHSKYATDEIVKLLKHK